MIRWLLDWTTLTYSPARRAADGAYWAAWVARRLRARKLPIIGAFFRAWEAA